MDQPAAAKKLRILMLEDAPTDAELIEHELRKAGIEFTAIRVETRDAFSAALAEFKPDIVLSDFQLPSFDGMSAVRMVRSDHPEVPVIIVTGALTDADAVELLRAGARDYVLKDRLARLGDAVQRVLSMEQGIRARKAAEEGLRESYEQIALARDEWNNAFDAMRDLMFFHDSEYRITRCNRAYAERAGLPFNEIIGRYYWEIFPKIGGPLSSCRTVMEMHADKRGEEVRLESGETFVSRSFTARRADGGYLFSVHIMEDITERKRAENALQESLIRYSSLTEGANDAIICVRPDGAVELWNKMAEQMFGFSQEEVMGKPLHQLVVPERYRSQMEAGLERFRSSGVAPMLGKAVEAVAVRRDGTEFPIELSISAMNIAGEWHATGIIRDITERKKTEKALHRLNRALKALGAGDHALVHSKNTVELMQGICDAVTEGETYRVAWVGLAMNDEKKSIKPVAIAGKGRGYLENIQVTWADEPLGRGPTGTAVHTGQTQIAQDISKDPSMAPWRESAANYGLASSIALPLREDGQVIGALTLYAAETDAFDAQEVALLEEMTEDLGFGLMALRTRDERDRAIEERQLYAEQLHTSLEEALQAISATVEMRDPYTAGHQRRMAALAVAMARRLGLPDEQVHGIHLAGIVHDLGKIRVPAEILSKPGTLNEIEYSFIKIHSQAGYDILKGIQFPWPIAQTVLQHHERLDGSGYPQGLKGEQILLEAKILAVADVVEAMSSHRPYRPGLGLDAALQEIASRRGEQFDPAAVDCCIALFREQGFSFPQ